MSRLSMFDEAQQLIDHFELSHPPNLIMYSKYLLIYFRSHAMNSNVVDLSW